MYEYETPNGQWLLGVFVITLKCSDFLLKLKEENDC